MSFGKKGFAMSGQRSASDSVERVIRVRAAEFGWYPKSSTARSTLALTSAETFPLFKARDTLAVETPAARATSAFVTRAPRRITLPEVESFFFSSAFVTFVLPLLLTQ